MSTVEPDQSLAHVIRILGKFPIENARVLGWQVLGKIIEFQIGDLVVYCSINTVFPDDFEPTQILKGKPIKTKRMMKQISQGLIRYFQSYYGKIRRYACYPCPFPKSL